MKVTTRETTDEIGIIVDGDLDIASISGFESAVADAVNRREGRAVVVDLRRTDYIDSAGLEQLLVTNRKLMATAGRLRVRVKGGTQPQTVLFVTGFDSVMDVESEDGEK